MGTIWVPRRVTQATSYETTGQNQMETVLIVALKPEQAKNKEASVNINW